MGRAGRQSAVLGVLASGGHATAFPCHGRVRARERERMRWSGRGSWAEPAWPAGPEVGRAAR
jgi:hypothetical protein